MESNDNASRDVQTTTLANGVRVITERMPHVRSVSVGVWIGSGSRREKPDQNGVSQGGACLWQRCSTWAQDAGAPADAGTPDDTGTGGDL